MSETVFDLIEHDAMTQLVTVYFNGSPLQLAAALAYYREHVKIEITVDRLHVFLTTARPITQAVYTGFSQEVRANVSIGLNMVQKGEFAAWLQKHGILEVPPLETLL